MKNGEVSQAAGVAKPLCSGGKAKKKKKVHKILVKIKLN